MVITLLAIEVGAAQWFGGQRTLFFAINNGVQILAVIGVANLWVQSGLKASAAAVVGVALAIYDFLFTAVLPLMADLYAHLTSLPFAPLVAWPLTLPEPAAVPVGHWIGIGLGDLLLAVVFPIVMRKAYRRQAGLIALLIALGSIGGLLVLLWEIQIRMFPVMVVLGPLMMLQYLYWRYQYGPERTTWQYRQAEPVAVKSFGVT